MGVVLDGHGGIEDMTVVASTIRITYRSFFVTVHYYYPCSFYIEGQSVIIQYM
jgi:hypothetical protein